MITKKLYLESIEAAYLEEFTAEVIALEDNKIVLDQTLFYPLGGGQNWDLGTLDGPNGKMNVVEVRGRDTIQHSIEDTFELEIGDEVTGRIDFERRYAHMKMHTAQHLVSGIAYEMFNGVERLEIRFTLKNLALTSNRFNFQKICCSNYNQLLMKKYSLDWK